MLCSLWLIMFLELAFGPTKVIINICSNGDYESTQTEYRESPYKPRKMSSPLRPRWTPKTGHRCSDRSSRFPAPCSIQHIQPPNQRLVMLGQRPGVARRRATGDRCHRDCHSRRAPACNRAQLSATSATNAREGKSLRRRAMRANDAEY